MCIESCVFCDAGSGLTRWGFGPVPFGLAWPEKCPEGCAWAADQARWTTMARRALPCRAQSCRDWHGPVPCRVDGSIAHLYGTHHR